MNPPAPKLSTLALGALLGLALGLAFPACAPLTPPQQAELRAAEPAILAADELACDESAMIPIVGAVIAAVACPLEVAAVKGAIDRAVAPVVAPDAGPTMASAGALSRVYRATRGGGRKVIGKVAATAAGAVQFHLFVMPPLTVPPPVSPAAVTALPDGGAEAGR